MVIENDNAIEKKKYKSLLQNNFALIFSTNISLLNKLKLLNKINDTSFSVFSAFTTSEAYEFVSLVHNNGSFDDTMYKLINT